MKKMMLVLAVVAACDSPTVPERFLRDVYEFRLVSADTLVLRWPVGTTIKVLATADDDATRTQHLRAAVTHAVSAWNAAALYGEVRLEETTQLAQADVVVRYSQAATPLDLGACLPSGGLAATTFCLTEEGDRLKPFALSDGTPTNVKFVVTIRTTSGSDAVTVRRLITHEMGHALGISGHSNTSTHLMYFGALQVDAPQQADRMTLQVLYHTRADIIP